MNHNVTNDGQENFELIDVILKLWRGKFIVISCIIFSLLLSVVYLKFAPEKWTSTALITQPVAGQLAGYIDVQNAIYGNSAPSISESQKLFLNRFKSSFYALSEDNSRELGGIIIFETMTVDRSKVLSQGSSIPLDPSLPFKISFTIKGVSAEQVQSSLMALINEANKNAIISLKNDLTVALKSRSLYLKRLMAIEEKISADRKSSYIKDIENALNLAKTFGCSSHQYNELDSLDRNTMFMLGRSNLETLLASEKERPLIYPEKYYSLFHESESLETINVKTIKINSYHYLTKPSLPAFRDSPKNSLVLILATLVGFMIGSGVVLGRAAIKKYKQQS